MAAQFDTITAVTIASCPELPSLWMIAQVEAESGWDPTAFSADRNGGSAGALPAHQASWRGACGRPAVVVFIGGPLGDTGWCGAQSSRTDCAWCEQPRHSGRCPECRLRPAATDAAASTMG